MRCDKLVVENYGSYYGVHELPLADQGLVFVRGDNRDEPRMNSNGAGKSSGTCEALEWCCFGVVPKGDHVDSVINDTEGKNTRVTSYWSDGPDYSLVVARFRKQQGKTSGAAVWVNGDELTALDTAETQRIIERELGLDHQVFRAAVVFGQGDRFMFADSTDKERLEVCTKIFQMDEVDAWLVAAKELREETQPLVDGWLRELSARRARLSEHEALQEKVRAQADAWEADNKRTLDGCRQQRGELVTYQDTTTVSLDKAKFDLSQLGTVDDVDPETFRNPEAATVEARRVELEQQRAAESSLQIPPPAELDPLRAQRSALEQRRGELRGEYRSVQMRVEKSNSTVAKYRALGVGLCRECGQEVTQEHLDCEIARLEQESQAICAELAAVEDYGKAVEFEVQGVCANILELEQQHQAAVTAQQAKVAGVHAELSRIAEQLRAFDRDYQTKVSAYEVQKQQFRVFQQSVGTLERYLTETADKIRLLDREIEQVSARVNPFSAQDDVGMEALGAAVSEAEGHVAQGEYRLKLVQFWVDACGPAGIKNYVLDTRLHELTLAANQGVLAMTGGTHWVQLDTVTAGRTTKTARNRINVRVFKYNTDGAVVERGYRSYSGGEKQRVSLGIDFGLAGLIAHRAHKQFEVLFLDELFRHLDQAGKEAVVDMLGQLRATKRSVFVIEHDNEFAEHFDREVLVVKEGGRSRYVLEELHGHGDGNQEAQQAGAAGLVGLQADPHISGPREAGAPGAA